MIKHGNSGKREYHTWHNMISRCTNKNHRQYKHYGGRGISVCEQWANSFDAFYSDMGAQRDGMLLERINNDGNYEPPNCKWATYEEQLQNTRRNKLNPIAVKVMRYMFDNDLATIPNLASAHNLNYDTVWNAVTRKSWKNIE